MGIIEFLKNRKKAKFKKWPIKKIQHLNKEEFKKRNHLEHKLLITLK